MDEIELLYFDGCPHWKTAFDNLRQALEAENLHFQVRLIEITSPQQAQDESFQGSPSFRMNGKDFWPETREIYNMSCRVYQTARGISGSPSIDVLRERIREILSV